MDLDVEFARGHFPALTSGWALFDNAGGVMPPTAVIDRVSRYMSSSQVQLGASYDMSLEATRRVIEGRQAMARLLHAEPDEIVIGSSTTMNVYVLANALRPRLRAGDEIVVTNLDHEANVGAWRRLTEFGVVLREWSVSPETCELHLEELAPLLSERTRLVAFTHCSNLVGTIHDVRAITRAVHDVGALVCVDGVAFAPHRRVDVKALDVDFYLLSAYKVFGPHQGVLYGKRERLLELASQNHFFIGEGAIPYKLSPGNVNHELCAGLPGVLEYLDAIHDRHYAGGGGDDGERLDRVFALVARHEEVLGRKLLDFLAHKRGVRLFGTSSVERHARTSIFSFTVEGRRSSEIPPLVDRAKVAIRAGHFYAYRACEALGLLASDGVVRVSMIHYNALNEVDRLIAALDEAI